ncbi:hypothetical protein Tco_1467090, partial [Tanacetum coccineum]
YGKIWYDEDVYDLRSVETKFPAIVFNDSLTSNEPLSCEPTVSSLNDNEIDFRISFDEFDDEDYTPTVSCIDDLDFFKDFENVFSAIIYNDALTSKSDLSTKPTLCLQHIDEFDLKDETSLSEYDKVEQNVLNFNDLFPFNIIYPDDLKSDKGNDDNEIDMIQFLGGNENTQGSNKLLEGSHDKINKVFVMRSFVMKLNVKIMAYNHLINMMLFNLIKNLYVPFGIPFDPKCYGGQDMALPPRDQRHQYLRFGEVVLDLDTAGALQFQLGGTASFGLYWTERARRILDKGVLSTYWIKISSMGDFMGTPPSYTLIRDLMLRLCHRLIGCSIAGRSQAPKKVLEIICFKEEICIELDDTWAWVLAGPARKEGDAGGVVEEAPVAPGGGDEDEEMPQVAPPQPRTQGERIARLEEEMHCMREALLFQREVLDSMASDFSRFTTWTITSLARLMDRADVPYTRYSESPFMHDRIKPGSSGNGWDNSSPRPPEDFHANPNTIIESLPTFPIPVEDSNSLRKEIDTFPGLDDSIPPGIESDNYDSEGDDNSTSLPKLESFHVDYPDSGDSTIDVVEDIPIDVPNILPTHPTLHMDFDFIPSYNDLGSDLDVSSPSGDRNKIYDPGIFIKVESMRFLATLSPVIDTLLPFSSKNEDKVFNHGVLASKEKSPPFSSHRGFKASKLFHHKSPMLIHGENNPNLGVRHLHFIPLDKAQVWGI